MTTLIENLERTTNFVQDPIIRNYAIRLLQGIDDLPMEVLGVGKMRQAFPQIRHRVHEGVIALVASRGEVKDEPGTTMMISLENFNRLFISLYPAVSRDANRANLTFRDAHGNHSIPALAEFGIDFNSITYGHKDDELAELSF